MKILVTGGAGYIGSTICSALSDLGHIPVILDSLVSGAGEFTQHHIFYKGDIDDKEVLARLCSEHPEIHITIHCAEMPASPKSVKEPYEYYHANAVKSMEFFKNAIDIGLNKIIFSSSASIYDVVAGYLVNESSPIKPRSPFARTKYITEMILRDFCLAYNAKAIALRCFNPVGADPKLRSGGSFKSKSIIDRLMNATAEEKREFKIAGVDWGTRDGSGIRDYVHVWDMAMAHVKAAENFDGALDKANAFYLPINIGSGLGVTVKEFVAAFQNVCGESIRTIGSERRPGDVAGAYAGIKRAKELIGWQPERPVEEAILDTVRWYEKKMEQ